VHRVFANRRRATFAVALLGSAAALVLAGCATHERWLLVPGQHPQSFLRTVRVEAQGQLLLYLPADFRPRGSTRYPLLVFLHGSGESGPDLEKLKVHGPPKFLDTRPDFPFIVASPQARNSVERFDPTVLDAMLDELLSQLPIDRDRVYLTGLSMGGMWTYGWASLHSERFAAIAPVAGLWDPADACRLRDIPIWSFHGAKDDVVPLAGDQAMIDAINACGGHARLTVYPEAGHDSWTETYSNPELYTWLLQQRRPPRGRRR
jgi:predicted peptidase